MRAETMREWLFAFLEAGLIVLVLYFICWPVNIDGISMEETFQTGDKAFISKALVLLGMYDYGDIVVCSVTTPAGEKEKVIKRVIALAGDHIVIKNGDVIRNGVLLEEPYAQGKTKGELDFEVPQGNIFVLGDNRERSLDSRQLGAIPLKKVNGRAMIRFFPFHKIHLY